MFVVQDGPTENGACIAAVGNVKIRIFDQRHAGTRASRADLQQIFVDGLRIRRDGFGTNISIELDERTLQATGDVGIVTIERGVHFFDVLQQVHLMNLFDFRVSRVLVRIVVRMQQKRGDGIAWAETSVGTIANHVLRRSHDHF